MTRVTMFHMSNLIILSNRGPYRFRSQSRQDILEKCSGGLVSVLEPLMNQKGGFWLSAPCESGKSFNSCSLSTKYNWGTISCDKETHKGFYDSYSNQLIWPIFHSMLNKSSTAAESSWGAYKRVNQTFAQATCSRLNHNDLVWVHDYHLFLSPQLIRSETNKSAKIGFFLHIPFPSAELLKLISHAKDILHGLLGSDFIGFHTKDYQTNFLDSVQKLLGYACDFETGTILAGGRQVKTKALPIGIDLNPIQRIVNSTNTQERAEAFRNEIGTEKLVVGVDRLDYTKGILNRLQGFEQYLKQNPDWVGKVSMIQLAVPTRTQIDEYKTYKQQVENQVQHINTQFGSKNYTPVDYRYQTMPFNDLIALYQAADIALITPLRDGMNLVAKEYVASKQNGGVLILSKLAGAAAELKEAILVNPYDTDSITRAIGEALKMPAAKQQHKMAKMQLTVQHNDMKNWADRFLSELSHAE
ncbi:MAG: trehalose-6-phosphate synthase [Deltaproteobacteria bacterium]|nr:trehalose-6-phosphate synthase [Deltaproteobacteria bacterium]